MDILFCLQWQINSGDFKLCGEVMMMSVMQGAAPNFLASPVVCYITGKPLSPLEIQKSVYNIAFVNSER